MWDFLRRARVHSGLMYGLRLLLGFGVLAYVPYYFEQQMLTIPLSLGLMAAALSDIDDRFSLRIRNMLLSYLGFFLTAGAIHVLYPYPIVFGCALIISCFVLIILGSLGRRYAQLSFGCLIISIYALLGVHFFERWYEQGVWFVLGAMWYGILSTLSFLLFPARVVQDYLTQCYRHLAEVLDAKAALFDVDLDQSSYQAAMVELTLNSAHVSTIFDGTREALVTRLKGDRGQSATRRALHYYFIAQDIRERADSAHIDYLELAKVFKYRDIMFRLQRILMLQAKACQSLSESMARQQPYRHSDLFKRLFKNFDYSLLQLQQEQQFEPMYITALAGVKRNLIEIDRQLASFADDQPHHYQSFDDDSLYDDRLQGWADIVQRIKQNFTPQSSLFRHAVRLSVLAVVAHAIVQVFQLSYGYWILLTILFVCQPNFNATRRRLKLRIYGTLGGTLIGGFVLHMIPSTEGLLMISVLCAVAFFHFRTKQYAQATLFLTIFALINFHLAQPVGHAVLPRAIFTIIGCAIAGLGSMWIFPDWKYRRLDAIIRRTLSSECVYLAEVFAQYRQGSNHGLDYRSKRRQAHNMDSELASVIATLGTEPYVDESHKQQAYRFLTLNHTFLSYISALSAHRQQLHDADLLQLMDNISVSINGLLLRDETLRIEHGDLVSLRQQLSRNQQVDDIGQLVVQQLTLMVQILPELSQLKQQLMFAADEYNALAVL